MTATDELRRLLDERGVEWKDYNHDNHTWWSDDNNIGWHAENRPAVTGSYVKIEAVLTPEQAIAATLGRGTCEWILDHSGTLYDKWRCSKCGYLFVESRVDQGIKDDFDPNYCPNCGKAVKQ